MSRPVRVSRSEGDRIALMVLSLCRAVRDEVKRDDLAPSDWLNEKSQKSLAYVRYPQASTAEVHWDKEIA